jgi:nicotinamide-nucleotide amidase
MERLLPLAEEVAHLLKARKETVAVAESSTGGLIAAALLAVPGASAYCRGGLVIYTRNVLYALKDVDKDTLRGLTPATEEYALFEARLARERMAADWGIGETGAAGPSGNSYGNPPGHTCVAVWHRAGRAATLNTGETDRVENMYAFSEAALELLATTLKAAP